MYLDYFGLSEPPFQATPNPRYIFLSRSHKEAFAHLLYGLEQQAGFILLTGEIGTGKTTVLRTLLHQLDDDRYTCALILNPCQSAEELLHALLREFGLEPLSNGVAAMRDQLADHLFSVRRKGGTAVLIIDEAQNLPLPVLEQVRQLSNLETETDKLIQIVLVGQPELAAMLHRSELRQLRQRIAISAELTPLDRMESTEYLRHRLRIAGWQGGELFTPEALELLADRAGGFPRTLNLLADRSLLVAYTEQGDAVTRSHVGQAIAERGERPDRRLPLILPPLLFLILFAAGFAAARFIPTSATIESAVTEQAILPFAHEDDALDALARRSGQPLPGDLLRAELPLERLLRLQYPAIIAVPAGPGKGYVVLDGAEGGELFGWSTTGDELCIPLSLLAQERHAVVIPWSNPYHLPALLGAGGTGEPVGRLHALLRRLGYPLEGELYDAKTQAAVASVQRSNGLPADGVAGPQTLMLLYRLTGLVTTHWRGE